HLAHAADHHRRGRRSLGDLLPAVVGQGAYPTVDVPADEVVGDVQRAVLDQHGGDRAPAPLEVGVNDGADGGAVRIRLEVQDLGGQDDGRQQVVEALAGPGRDVDALVLPTVVDGDQPLLRQLAVHPVDVRVV